MSGFNLPPGVTANMIPGNRPEDDEYAEILEKIKGAVMDTIDDSENFGHHDIPEILRGVCEDLEQEYLK